MKNNANLSLLILAILASLVPFGTAWADDGGWSSTFTIQGGSIYTEKENPDIALVRELLFFDGSRTVAFFLFENTSNKDVSVTCGFPVRYSIDGYLENGVYYVNQSKYGPGDVPALLWFETETIESSVDEYGDPLFFNPLTVPANAFNNSREFINPAAADSDITFNIIQDGAPVSVSDILVERECGAEGLYLTFHHRHELVFKAGKRSLVRVEYTQDLTDGAIGGIPGNTYRWEYVIGTGRTWKGPIGELFFIKPAAWTKEDDLLKPLDISSGWEVHYASRWEPAPGDVFVCTAADTGGWEHYSYTENGFAELLSAMEKIRPGSLPKVPDQRFVTGIKASSSLTDTADVYTLEGVIKGAGFGPLSAFDGIPETAWCEGKKDDGLGEYLEFTLTRPVWGVEILGGFTRLPLPQWAFESDFFETELRNDGKKIRDWYTLNNSAALLEIADGSGKPLYTLSLEQVRVFQSFPGVILPPGNYRLVIRGVHAGTAWKDTCIGEVRFFEAGTEGPMKTLWTEPFYRDAFRSLVQVER